jgi:hypothetical protein
MQNREELRLKDHDRSRKRHVVRGGKISFSEGGGNKYRFRIEILTPELNSTQIKQKEM